jgi:hypothetical protein
MFKNFILGLRFILEVTTIIGIFIGSFNAELSYKIYYISLAILIVVIWSRYGSPKSPTTLTGIKKLLLEIAIYGIGIISFYSLYDFKIATSYTIIVIFDLVMMYVLKLQGH